MKTKTSELIGLALDWAVCKAEGEELAALNIVYPQQAKYFPTISPSTNWSLAGLIIEREGIAIREIPPVSGDGGRILTRRWIAEIFRFPGGPRRSVAYGTTPLIAAMRAYVASRLGDEIEIPEELK